MIEKTGRPFNVLVIDDERHIRSTLRTCIEGEGHEVLAVGSAADALAAAKEDTFDVAFLDIRLGSESGLDLLPTLIETLPRLKVIVITAYATIQSAVDAMQRGASDYLPKPFEPAQVRLALDKATELLTLERQIDSMRSVLVGTRPSAQLESRNPEMAGTIQLMRRVAATDATILLQGESGTGKGVYARAIHAWSERSAGPFAVVHAPSLSVELLESELFGHVKGAFTGAVQANPGRVSQAEGGSLFLDEIGDLPLALQTKLLRFAQEREYERVGDTKTRRADVRIIAATNQKLDAAVQDGRFREDLYYRLKVVDVTIPPLRERPEDIPTLANEFLGYYTRKYNRKSLQIGAEAAAALRRNEVTARAMRRSSPKMATTIFSLRYGSSFSNTSVFWMHLREKAVPFLGADVRFSSRTKLTCSAVVHIARWLGSPLAFCMPMFSRSGVGKFRSTSGSSGSGLAPSGA